jgi:hypothetical protein
MIRPFTGFPDAILCSCGWVLGVVGRGQRGVELDRGLPELKIHRRRYGWNCCSVRVMITPSVALFDAVICGCSGCVVVGVLEARGGKDSKGAG